MEVKAWSGAQPAFEAAAPQALFEARVPTIPAGFNLFPYAVAADGKRFLVNELPLQSTSQLALVLNWDAGLKQ